MLVRTVCDSTLPDLNRVVFDPKEIVSAHSLIQFSNPPLSRQNTFAIFIGGHSHLRAGLKPALSISLGFFSRKRHPVNHEAHAVFVVDGNAPKEPVHPERR